MDKKQGFKKSKEIDSLCEIQFSRNKHRIIYEILNGLREPSMKIIRLNEDSTDDDDYDFMDEYYD